MSGSSGCYARPLLISSGVKNTKMISLNCTCSRLADDRDERGSDDVDVRRLFITSSWSGDQI